MGVSEGCETVARKLHYFRKFCPINSFTNAFNHYIYLYVSTTRDTVNYYIKPRHGTAHKTRYKHSILICKYD